MKRLLVVLIGVLAVAAMAVPAALADSPHYIKGPSVSISGNSLTVSFKAAGLGNTTTSADFSLEGTADVTSQCFTKTGNPVNGVPKHETVNVDLTQKFAVRNGSVTGAITVSPLSTLTCTGNQHVVIQDVSYDLILTGPGLPDVPLSSS